MTLKEPRRNRPLIAVTLKPRTLKALDELVKNTGNRSFIVNLAIEEYLGLAKEPSNQDNEKLAS